MKHRQLLFICTGNYYRSRFAEIYFNFLAQYYGYGWEAFSRGLKTGHPANIGRISPYAVEALGWYQIPVPEPQWYPCPLSLRDLDTADRIIAVKDTEHRPMVQTDFPEWEDRIEFWEIHDLDVATPEQAIPLLKYKVEELFGTMRYQETGVLTWAV